MSNYIPMEAEFHIDFDKCIFLLFCLFDEVIAFSMFNLPEFVNLSHTNLANAITC